LEDNFNTENGGVPQLNYNSFTNWTVTAGRVDLTAYYVVGDLNVDLDGSFGLPRPSGRLQSRAVFALEPGDYELRFDIGNGPQFPTDTNTTVVSLGSVFSESFTRTGAASLQTIVRNIAVTTSTTGRLIFDSSADAGDNGGIIIDNVRLSNLDQPDLAPTLLRWSSTGAEFAYEITGADVPEDTTVALYWASGPSFSDRLGGPIYSIPAERAVGEYGPFHVRDAALSAPPRDTTHLLVVTDPFGLIDQNQANDVQSISQVCEHSVGNRLADYHSVLNYIDLKFKPPWGMMAANQVCDVHHFNWIQEIIVAPDNWRWYEATLRGENLRRLQLPLYDPIVNAAGSLPTTYVIHSTLVDNWGIVDYEEGQRDDRVFMWQEIDPANTYHYTQNTTPDHLSFEDAPDPPRRFFDVGDYEEFRTRLVGVRDGTYISWTGLGTNFFWTYDGTTSVLREIDAPPSPIPEGGKRPNLSRSTASPPAMQKQLWMPVDFQELANDRLVGIDSGRPAIVGESNASGVIPHSKPEFPDDPPNSPATRATRGDRLAETDWLSLGMFDPLVVDLVA
jgi:hypothetical protein